MKNEIISGMGFHHIALKVADFEKIIQKYDNLPFGHLSCVL